ncbi:MAG: hypothetical protein SPL39_09985 [Selenomonadaceae bacterium]|nr:hypothetical protein [Selenomonadaceae bacterium]
MYDHKFNNGYGLITLNDICVCHSYDNLRDVLQQVEHEPFCEVFSAPTFEEASIIMQQRYPQQFFRFGIYQQYAPLALAAGNSDYWFRRNDSEHISFFDNSLPMLATSMPDAANNSVSTYGYGFPSQAYRAFWGISFAQGFAVHSNENYLLSLLASTEYLYTHAVKCSTEQAAAKTAVFEYTSRFYRRYQSICINLPPYYLQDGQCIKNENFEANEAGRSENETWQKLRGFGLW